jgi:hypothetical protein
MVIYAYLISFWVVIVSGVLLAVVGTIAYRGSLEVGHNLAGPLFCLIVVFGLSLGIQIGSRFTSEVQQYRQSKQGAVHRTTPFLISNFINPSPLQPSKPW